MSRGETAARALAIAATVALAVGIYALMPHLRAERWAPVVLQNTATESSGVPVTLLVECGARSGVYEVERLTSLADILALAGVADADAAREVYVTIGDRARVSQPQRVDINYAEAWLLQALPGIGPEKARAIVEYRDSHGQFASIDELALVPGIGRATCEVLADFATVSP